MNSLENLDEQIKDIILLNGGDIDIEDYPLIIKEAAELGINRGELVRKIAKVFNGIEWAPYHRIDKKLETNLLRGSISEKEAEEIVESAANDLQRIKVLDYILISIKKRGFLPREKNSFEHDSFKNRWMTDEAWTKYQRDKIVVEWLKEEAHSLAEMGEISYRKPEDAKYYLRNTNYLIPNITTLTKSPSIADEFSKIIEDEPNLDKRYLKVLYRLDPKLPFNLDKMEFGDVYRLVDKTATNYHTFMAASESYENGHIQIWLRETDVINMDKITIGFDYNSFLRFVYKINPHHPFYLNAEKFDNPQQLMQKAGLDASLWNKIATAAENEQLTSWLSAIGQQELVTGYNEYKKKITSYGFYTEEELNLSMVEYLINTIDLQTSKPHIESDQKEIKLLAIEGSRPINHTFYLKLVNTGYTIANISIDNPVDGIRLNNEKLAFWSQNHLSTYGLIINIDTAQLTRNKIYSFKIVVNTDFEKLVIPVEAKAVFPLKSYVRQLIKYAIFGSIFFALIRYITGIMTGNDSNVRDMSNDVPGFLPQHYFSYFIGLVLLLGGLIGAIFLIKKIEKI